MNITAEEQPQITDLLEKWFSCESLQALMGKPETETEQIGLSVLQGAGQRWRPLLTASVFQIFQSDIALIQGVATAVECFHKASLIHDDVEDNDTERYGLPTVHAQYGIPCAVNTGDYLIGEGYRLLATVPFAAEVNLKMLHSAAAGHKKLCLGQGDELAFCRNPRPLDREQVIAIYERKTATAFEVAVVLGAIAAGLDSVTTMQLAKFSRAVGIAYQIQDDAVDFYAATGRNADMLAMRPTLFLAFACCSDDHKIQALLPAAWQGDAGAREQLLVKIGNCEDIIASVAQADLYYQQEAGRIAAEITHPKLRALLFQILGKMLE